MAKLDRTWRLTGPEPVTGPTVGKLARDQPYTHELRVWIFPANVWPDLFLISVSFKVQTIIPQRVALIDHDS